MIEPPAHGFTGVVWEARPAEKLAHDLATGIGTTPMAETVAAWTRLGAQFGTAALDYDRIVTELRLAWRSDNSVVPLERLAIVRDWLLDAAGAAGANATRVAEHIATYELAKAAMPHPEEIAALVAAQQTIAQVGAMLGAPLIAAADDTELQQDAAKSSAARVMRTYELASEPLSTPWQQEPPPAVAPETALHAEQARARPAPPQPGAAPRAVVTGFPRLPVTPPPREPGAYRSPAMAQATTTPTAPATAATASTDAGSNRILPGAATSAAASATEDRSSRAGDATPYRADPGDIVEAIQAAPTVLGAAGETAPPVHHAEAS